jgi:hypothetical protein
LYIYISRCASPSATHRISRARVRLISRLRRVSRARVRLRRREGERRCKRISRELSHLSFAPFVQSFGELSHLSLAPFVQALSRVPSHLCAEGASTVSLVHRRRRTLAPYLSCTAESLFAFGEEERCDASEALSL